MAEYDKGARSRRHTARPRYPVSSATPSEIFDLPGPRIRVIAPDVGGGSAAKRRSIPRKSSPAPSAGRWAAGKWVSDRMEDLMTTGHAFDEVVYADIAVADDGAIVGLKADVIGDVGAYSIYPWTATIEPVQVVSLPGLYRIENYAARVRSVATNKTMTGAYRGVRPISVFVMDRLLDMAARKIGMDPAEIRRRNRERRRVSLQGGLRAGMGQIRFPARCAKPRTGSAMKIFAANRWRGPRAAGSGLAWPPMPS